MTPARCEISFSGYFPLKEIIMGNTFAYDANSRHPDLIKSKFCCTNVPPIYWWKYKECDYKFKHKNKQKKHLIRKHGWTWISTGSTGFTLFKYFSGSTGLIGSTSGLCEGLFDEVTSSEVAVSNVTVWEGTDCLLDCCLDCLLPSLLDCVQCWKRNCVLLWKLWKINPDS